MGLSRRRPLADKRPAAYIVPTEKCLEIDDAATIQAICCRLGLAIPGLHMRTRCLSSCTQMGPHAVLADRTVRENITTGLHLLGCKCCGTYDRHSQVAQVALAYFRYELKFSGSTGSTSSVGSNFKCGYFCGWQEQAHRRTGLGGGGPPGCKDWPWT